MPRWTLLLCQFVATMARLGQTATDTDQGIFNVTLRMPHVLSDENDRMICLSHKLDKEEAYILGYEPLASKETAHHLMVYGCLETGSSKSPWPCSHVEDESGLRPVCNGSREIVYAWALDAPSMSLPEGVGLRVGGGTAIKFLVLQLHYKNKFKGNTTTFVEGLYIDGQTDDSGVTLHMTYTPQEKQAGFYIMGNYGYIPPRQPEFFMESGCTYDMDYPIFPISYRVHAHNLGYVTSAYRVRDDQWTEIGRMSPQLPEAFYPVSTRGMDIHKGDGMFSRCTMNSKSRDNDTYIGSTYKDEMCNFYLLYYTYHTGNLRAYFCFRDAQSFHWSNYVDNIPAKASSLDGIPGADEVDKKFSVK